MTALARRLDATEGQVWSLAIGLIVAVVLALAGIPPVVHHARQPSAAPASKASASDGRKEQALTPVTQPAVVAPPAGDLAVNAPRGHTVTTSRTAPVAEVPTPEPFGTITPFASVDARLGGLAVAGGRVYVATDDDHATHIFGFDAAGKRVADIAATGQPGTHASGINALAAEAGGTLVGTDVDTNRVLRIDPADGHITTVATIVDLPSCALAPGAPACEPGLEDHKPHLTGIAAAADGTILVADNAQATVWRLRPGAAPEAWSQSIQQASGDGPNAVAIAPDGSVLETVGIDLNPSNPTSAAVYRVPVAADGTAGEPVLVAKLARGDQPAGISASPDGRIFVSLRAAATIAVLGADGGEQARLAGNDLQLPAAIALGADGELFATAVTPSGAGRVLRISV